MEWRSPKGVSPMEERMVFKEIMSRGDFGPCRTKDIEKRKGRFTTDQLCAMRKMFMRSIVIRETHLVRKSIRSLVGLYKAGKGILELSMMVNFPPLELFRYILQARSHTKYNDVKGIIEANRQTGKQALSQLTARDRKELRIAQKNDIISFEDQTEALRCATKFEDEVGAWLRQKRIGYTTQEQVAEQQKAKYGRAVATPDFLLTKPTKINGITCGWIEVKNYYGTEVPYMLNSVRKQVARYVDRWGPGALVFSKGFNCGLVFRDVLVLGWPAG